MSCTINELVEFQPRDFVSSVVSGEIVNGQFSDPTHQDGGRYEPTG